MVAKEFFSKLVADMGKACQAAHVGLYLTPIGLFGANLPIKRSDTTILIKCVAILYFYLLVNIIGVCVIQPSLKTWKKKQICAHVAHF